MIGLKIKKQHIRAGNMRCSLHAQACRARTGKHGNEAIGSKVNKRKVYCPIIWQTDVTIAYRRGKKWNKLI